MREHIAAFKKELEIFKPICKSLEVSVEFGEVQVVMTLNILADGTINHKPGRTNMVSEINISEQAIKDEFKDNGLKKMAASFAKRFYLDITEKKFLKEINADADDVAKVRKFLEDNFTGLEPHP